MEQKGLAAEERVSALRHQTEERVLCSSIEYPRFRSRKKEGENPYCGRQCMGRTMGCGKGRNWEREK